MPNINIFKTVVHEKKRFKVFYSINLYKLDCDPRDVIWTNLNLLVLRMFHAKHQHIQASGSREDF